MYLKQKQNPVFCAFLCDASSTHTHSYSEYSVGTLVRMIWADNLAYIYNNVFDKGNPLSLYDFTVTNAQTRHHFWVSLT
jgi:hypothetical protein